MAHASNLVWAPRGDPASARKRVPWIEERCGAAAAGEVGVPPVRCWDRREVPRTGTKQHAERRSDMITFFVWSLVYRWIEIAITSLVVEGARSRVHLTK